MDHFDHLESHVPDLRKRRILDLGSGRGKFLFYCKARGVNATGLEYNQEYIDITKAKAKELGVEVEVVRGEGEKLPFPDASFDFINISEVIEHVQDPAKMLSEAFRVLSPLGYAYLSVPNRYGMRDPHFHLYFVNWLPRKWAGRYISLCGKHKNYEEDGAGLQRLDEMHYYTLSGIDGLLRQTGFTHSDQRILRIKGRLGSSPLAQLAILCYLPFRFAYFDAFHLLLKKDTAK